jgi:hypothetical protein
MSSEGRLRCRVYNWFPCHTALLNTKPIIKEQNILIKLTANTLSSPFDWNSSFRACLCIGRDCGTQTLTISSNIAPTSVEHTLVKIGLKRYF